MKYTKTIILSCLLTNSIFAQTNYKSDSTKAVELLKTSKTITGQKISYPKGTKDNPQQITVVKTTIAPGGSTGWHLHKIPEVIYINKGTLNICILQNGKVHREILKAGEANVEAINTIHQGKNLGKDPIEINAVFIGSKNIPNVTPTELPSSVTPVSSYDKICMD